MNKIKAVITAGIMALTSAAALCASAAGNTDNELPEDFFTYEAYCEFKPIETEGVFNMPDGSIFVDISEMGEDGLTIPVEMYMYDKYDRMGQIIIKVMEPQYKLDIINPRGAFEKYGRAPYKNYESDSDIAIVSYPIPDTDKYMLCSMYGDYGSNPLKLTGEHSWDVPLFMYDIKVDNDTRCGSFYVFAADNSMVWKACNTFIYPSFSYRYPENPSLLRTSYLYDVTEPLHVQVSDRALGDINDDNVINKKDAEWILKRYTLNCGSAKPIGNNAFAAADVNGDGEVTDEDAEIVMDYVVSGEEISFYEYLEEFK